MFSIHPEQKPADDEFYWQMRVIIERAKKEQEMLSALTSKMKKGH